jgi:hypothetical protein
MMADVANLALLDGHILAFDVAGFAETPAEAGHSPRTQSLASPAAAPALPPATPLRSRHAQEITDAAAEVRGAGSKGRATSRLAAGLVIE